MFSNYSETVAWLFSKLPMFQRIGGSAYKNNLDNIIALTQNLDNPQNRYPTLHIAGTNGKGSCSHMLASVLQEANYKVGLTTSPHLIDFRERIRVNGKVCEEKFVIDFVNHNKPFIETLDASFFEVSIAMAFAYFAQEKVDVAVIETGLGGRLDSTNIIRPVLSVITNISLDHTQFLGKTLKEIATEKAGIIKENIPVVIGETTEETKAVFLKTANEKNAEIIFAEEHVLPEYDSDLKGFYQKKNRQTVLNSIKVLQQIGFKIDSNAIQKGFLNVIKNTGLRGRWDILGENPLLIADTAHNESGIREIVKQIGHTPHKNLHLVLGFVNDKDVLSILSLFPKNAKFYFTEPNVPRKLPIPDLKKVIPADLAAAYYKNVSEAVLAAKLKANPNDLIYIGGSSFVVAEVLE